MEQTGLHGHSSEVGGREYIIFAIDDPTEVTEFQKYLDDTKVGYKLLMGAYTNTSGEMVEEPSFIMQDVDFEEYVEQKGYADCQESVLHLGPCDARDRRPASIVYWDKIHNSGFFGDEAPIGWFQSCIEEVATAQPGYTYDPSTETFYACFEE